MAAVVLAMTATQVSAEVQLSEARPFAASSTGSEVVGLLQLTGSLLMVLAGVFAAAWVLRRLQLPGPAVQGRLQVLAQLPLGNREKAVLIQLGERQLLLGVAAGAVTTLHVLEEPLVLSSADDTRGVDFKAVLMRSLGRA